ncbi:MAG: YitT family protein [Pseudolactococcus laudensis]|uniref:YitT family protein n=1 Tax=Pseudolactococcus laudensis TaxID=1494461 RepID=A0A7V8MYT6_9LACT|nr:YitT family protein [Lactococcus laudensis]MBA0015589.1 YitT family protein [Lactococcus laudensis]MBR2763254.1 YitT family protein [Lactococcus sp.]MBW9280674.1 YitT family protein [Lactococcus laudensis]CCK19363.1 Transporter [Lactococcus raffinolactis 4877]
MNKEVKFHPLNFLMIALGTAIYAFGFVNFNMVNHLAEGGVSGITLIFHALFKINPAYTQILLNIPLFILGVKIFGKRGMIYTIHGTVCLSVFIWLFQRMSFSIDLAHDTLIAALLAGIFAGIGGGIVFRFGGTTGGGDIIGRYFEQKKGFALGQTLFVFDILVLTLSLSYIDIQHMMYTVIASFVFSQVVAVVQNGGYTVRGMLIISSKYAEISQKITDEIGRGATYLKAEGVYSGQDTKVIYVVLSPIQVQAVKGILAEIDPDAFVSIINVHEVIGSGFTYTEDLNL